MKTIRGWLEEEAGVALSITSLTSYVSRIRRRESRHSAAQSENALEMGRSETRPESTSSRSSACDKPRDPLASAMAILRQPRFDIRDVHGDGDPTDKNLI